MRHLVDFFFYRDLANNPRTHHDQLLSACSIIFHINRLVQFDCFRSHASIFKQFVGKIGNYTKLFLSGFVILKLEF